MQYSFIIDHTDFEEIRLNTTEVFENLYISRQPSVEEEVGYEIKGDTLIMKYEQNEDGRIILDSAKKFNGLAPLLPAIFGAVMHLHKLKKLKVCNHEFDVEVFINKPNGIYLNERGADGDVIRHELGGMIYRRRDALYCQINEMKVFKRMIQMRKNGIGSFIDPEILVRFEVNGKFVYQPAGHCYYDPVVAHSFNPSITDKMWLDKRDELNHFLDTLSQF